MSNIYDEILDADFGDIYEDLDYYGFTPKVSHGDAKRMLIQYLIEYGKYYTEQDLNFIKYNFLSYLGLRSPDTRLSQIYSHLDMYKDDNDPYLGYLDRFEEHFNVDSNILDIASGCYPAWAEKIAIKQARLGSGSITIYDPKLVISKPVGPMVLHKKCFNSSVSIQGFDVVTSILPCEVTNLVINSALENNKNFFVALCGCHNKKSDNSSFFTHDDIINKIYRNIKSYGNGTLEIDRLGNSYNNHLPILVYKSKKD